MADYHLESQKEYDEAGLDPIEYMSTIIRDGLNIALVKQELSAYDTERD